MFYSSHIMEVRVLLVCLCVLLVDGEYVRKKNCSGVESSQCSIHNVIVDPCPDGPGFCLLRRNKVYSVTADFTPHFEADQMKLAIFSDENNQNEFNTVLKVPADACGAVSCPIQENIRSTITTVFKIDKGMPSKFPIQLKMWNAADESQACCFTFTVRTLK